MVKVTINVKEKAGWLLPTSSCFIFALCVASILNSTKQKLVLKRLTVKTASNRDLNNNSTKYLKFYAH